MQKEKEKKAKLRRVLNVANINSAKTKKLTLSDEFYQFLGKPQDRGFWFLFGSSGSGKSTLAMKFAKEFSFQFKTLYDLHEERWDDSDFIDRMKLLQMQDVKDNFFVQDYNLKELDEYLESRNSAHFIIIDSTRYVFKNWDDYINFKRKWEKKKLVLIIGHAEGKNPRNELQKSIRDDCKMKFFSSGYLAINQGRTFGPKNTLIIWDEGYNKLQGQDAHKDN